jgi:hypothetical protein
MAVRLLAIMPGQLGQPPAEAVLLIDAVEYRLPIARIPAIVAVLEEAFYEAYPDTQRIEMAGLEHTIAAALDLERGTRSSAENPACPEASPRAGDPVAFNPRSSSAR